MAKSNKRKILAVSGLLAVILVFFFFDGGSLFTLNALKERQQHLLSLYQQTPTSFVAGFFLLYVLMAALSLPGAAVLTIGAGALFGFWLGVLIVSFASSIGATLAFLMTRYVMRDAIQKRYGHRFPALHRGIERDGSYYLFTLRLVPAIPFFLINIGMGLTTLPVRTFYIVSQLGMLLGTAVYVNAGTQLAKIDSTARILSFDLLVAFGLLGCFPLLTKKFVDYLKVRRQMRKFAKPRSYDYNLIVIGAGSAGLVAAYIAAAIKAKVALVEKHRMGGDCLNTGCVPSKALIRSAKAIAQAKKAHKLGLQSINIQFSFSEVMERVQRVIKTIEPHDSPSRYESLGVDCIAGSATILNPYQVQVGTRVLSTRNIIIATGARPVVPEIPGLASVRFHTSDTIWSLRDCPRRLLVLGGGPIGCEMAQAFQRLGSAVTLVEQADRLLSREDAVVSEFIHSKLRDDGVDIRLRHQALEFCQNGKGGGLKCSTPNGATEIVFDDVLLAMGRQANVDGFGASTLGIRLDERQRIAADEFMCTNFPNIFVCGDVTGALQFTHVAAHEAWYATVNALFRPWKRFRADYRVIPMVTFTDPEVARVGLNEQEAKSRGIAYELTEYGIDDLDRAIADEDAEGFVRVLTAPGKDHILGVTIVGAHAGELIAEFVLAMKYNLGLGKILGTIHSYPTLAEANKYAAGAWRRNHAPKRVLQLLERYHAWVRH